MTTGTLLAKNPAAIPAPIIPVPTTATDFIFSTYTAK
jgi:hypothetical protein